MSSDPHTGRPADRQRPWLWIGLTALFAVVAVGFAIWGFSQKSDADDARADAKTAQQRADRRLATTRARARQTESSQRAVDDQTKQDYRRVRARFVSEQTRAGDLSRDVTVQRQQLAQARQQLTNANTAEDRQTARLNVARQQADVSAACARGALSAIDRFFEAVNLDAAARRAVRALRRLQTQCQDAVGVGTGG